MRDVPLLQPLSCPCRFAGAAPAVLDVAVRQYNPRVQLSEFDFELPGELIAQAPPPTRAGGRLLHCDGNSGGLRDLMVRDLPAQIAPGDVLVFNDTRVIKARLNGHKDSGGAVEALIERVLSHDRALAQLRASHAPRPGSRLRFAGSRLHSAGSRLHSDTAEATVLGRQGEFFELRFEACDDVYALLEAHGSVPLPPYIAHAADAADEARYQTVYARAPGAVAAPTAGLHFDEAMLAALRARGAHLAWITLHVGAGTFQPVRVADTREHRMHSEWFDVPAATAEAIAAARSRGGRVVAVGTTALRALESAAAEQEGQVAVGSGDTQIFITPGYRFKVVDRLVTNFHLPKSTLLMLVSAFAGLDNIRQAYRHAVEARYRFFSYGDAMLLERRRSTV